MDKRDLTNEQKELIHKYSEEIFHLMELHSFYTGWLSSTSYERECMKDDGLNEQTEKLYKKLKIEY